MPIHSIDAARTWKAAPARRRSAACAAGAGFVLALLCGPLQGLGSAQEPSDTPAIPAASATAPEPEGIFPEPGVIERGIELATRISKSDGGSQKNGFYPEFSNMITGAGWLSVGPGYRHWLFGDRAFVDASTAISWRSYKMAQARFELTKLARSRLAVGSQVRWQDLTQVTYFGAGPESAELDRSEYRMQTSDVVGYAAFRPVSWFTVNGRVGWLVAPSLDTPTGSFKRGNPATIDVFPDDPVFRQDEQPDYLHGEASFVADTRDHRGYPSRGGMYRAGWTTFSDRDTDSFTFDRYDLEGAHFIPVARRRVVLALHGWLVATDTSPGQIVPFYLLPSLGGSSTLRSYSNYRFHDRNLLVVNAESRVALFRHVDLAAFVDAGNVAPRVADLNLDRTSYGLGFRVHSRTSTLARLDIAHGDEGWQMLFRLNDPFRFSRLSRRTAPVPFAP